MKKLLSNARCPKFIVIFLVFFSFFQDAKLRARVIQLEEDLSNTRQQHREAAQEVNKGFISLVFSSPRSRIRRSYRNELFVQNMLCFMQ